MNSSIVTFHKSTACVRTCRSFKRGTPQITASRTMTQPSQPDKICYIHGSASVCQVRTGMCCEIITILSSPHPWRCVINFWWKSTLLKSPVDFTWKSTTSKRLVLVQRVARHVNSCRRYSYSYSLRRHSSCQKTLLRMSAQQELLIWSYACSPYCSLSRPCCSTLGRSECVAGLACDNEERFCGF